MIPLRHNYNPLTHVAKSIDDVQGGYLRVTYRDGRDPKWHFVTGDYIDRCMRCSESWKGREKAIKNKANWIPNCPWTDGWFEQMAFKTVLRSAYARRVVPIDPMIAGRVEAFLKQEDSLLGNDPRLLTDGNTVEHAPAGPGLPAPASRSAALAGQLTQRQTYAPQPARQQLAERLNDPETVQAAAAAEQTATPAAGEITGDEPNGQAEPPEPKSLMGEFIDLLAEVESRRGVERLRDHYTGPDSELTLTAEQRTEVNTACDSKLKEFPEPAAASKSGKQKPLMQ
jgi:hypothetical protein